MKVKIQLFLKNWFFQEQEIEIPDYDDRMSFEDNVELRTKYLKLMSTRLATLYQPQIEKCQNHYAVYAVAPSKMEFVPLDENEIYPEVEENQAF